ncbi:MAG: PDDEXK nuclease domain-containing protein [Prevotellaceae bacterium]|jgi:predicted nuclease of restriction endonuclease-like (RecB) superfamily|nr:PDDEXK nuclease domain-containing protein [Prevotellaceae bacterium]
MANDIKNNLPVEYANSADLLQDACVIIDNARNAAYRAVNMALVQRNWMLGKRIAEEELQGERRAEYGAQVIKNLSKELTAIYGNGFTYGSLYMFTRFFKAFPEIFYTVCKQFDDSENSNIFHALSGKFEILDTVSPKSLPILTWSHYRTLLQVDNAEARYWYLKEAAEQTWNVRTLQRNISSQYYHRLLLSQNKQAVESEMKQLTSAYKLDKLEFIKNPVVAEFLGLAPNSDFTESELETSIISNLQKFLMELGKGYAFVARQQHIHTEKQDYFIDLVFYNYYLKCFVLIDLKTNKITHQDVGQMDMYIRMYDELKLTEGDNPTIGIMLCADTDEDIAKYSILHGNEQLFATKYKTFLPSEEELRNEIERQKQIFYLQQQENKI